MQAAHATLQLRRSAYDVYEQQTRPELIVIRCCSPLGSSPEKYAGLSAGLLTAVYLSPNYTTDWSVATGQSSGATARAF